jgi:hypothetical protein
VNENIHCCKYCRFYRVDRIGRCHKNPPVEDNFWPQVAETEWCGAFDGNKVWDQLMSLR